MIIKKIHVRFFIFSVCCIFKNSCFNVCLKSPLKITAVITLMRQVMAPGGHWTELFTHPKVCFGDTQIYAVSSTALL